MDGQLSPYRGLTPFEDSELDVLFFFGRERERELIEANLMASRLTVLYGETGVGKSSVLRAGVAHHLRASSRQNLSERGEPGLAVVVFDAWRDDPVTALGSAVADAVTDALGGTLPPPQETGSLLEALRTWSGLLDGDLYVILDQSEEYFLYHGRNGGEGSFAHDFAAVVNTPDLRVNFLFAIREDSLAKLDAFKGPIPNVLGNYLRLEHLDPEAARAAIVEPISRYNTLVGEDETVEVEPALVDAVLEQVVAGRVGVGQSGRGASAPANGAVRIETAYLQLVMQRLWNAEQSAGSRVLRLETLARLGGAQQVVHDHVDRALSDLTGREKDVVAAILDHLVTPSGAKIAHEVGDLATWAGVPESELLPVLAKLGDERILRSVSRDGAGDSGYEIFHDVLADPLLAWKADHVAQRELERQAAESEERHRRLLRLLAVSAVLLVAMVAVTVFALTQRSNAQEQATLAEARELVAKAITQRDVDPMQSIALGLESMRMKPTPEGESVLRDALALEHQRAILPSDDTVRQVSFSPDSTLVLTGSDDGTARIWRSSGELVRKLEQGGLVTAALFSPDGSLVLTASDNGTARIWRTVTGEVVATLRHGEPVRSATFNRDGTLVVTASDDGTARIWRTADGAPVLVVPHGEPVLGAMLSPNGKVLLTLSGRAVGTDKNLRARLFNARSGRLMRELDAIDVTTATFGPDGETVATGSADDGAAIWRVADGKRLLRFGDQGAVTDVVFKNNGRLLVTTSWDGATRVFNTRSGERVAFMQGHSNHVNGADLTSGGRYVVTASDDGTARVWEVRTGRDIAVLRGHDVDGPVDDAVFSPDGKLVATAGADGTARIWDSGLADDLRVIVSRRVPVTAATPSSDGRLLLIADEDGRAGIFTAAGRRVRALQPQTEAVTAAVFTPDGRRALTAGADGTLRVWDVATGRLLRTVLNISTGPLNLSPDGQRLAAPDRSGDIRVWSMSTFDPLLRLTKDAPFLAASFSPDGSLIATAGKDGVARIWDAESGAAVRKLEGHTAALTDAQFSPDGKLLVTSSKDHDARIWNIATGEDELLQGHFNAVWHAAFSPDGRWVVTAGPYTVGLWRVGEGRPLRLLSGHRSDQILSAAAFAGDETRIVSASGDGTVRTYRCSQCVGGDALVKVVEARVAEIARSLTPEQRREYHLPGGGE